MLKPVAVFPDATKENGALVTCEVMMPDGQTPHRTNARATILDDPDAWFGFEQEHFLYKDGVPLGFPKGGGFPPPQGKYYTGVGYEAVGAIAREIVDAHLDLCLDAGISHEGINAEVAKGLWEFQRQIQLRRRQPGRIRPRPAQFRQQRLPALPRGSPPQLAG
jgi:glutamine synthetase